MHAIDSEYWVKFLLANAMKGAFILMACFVASRILRHASAAVRHLLWAVALLCLLALPLLSLVLPGWRGPTAHSLERADVRILAPVHAGPESSATHASAPLARQGQLRHVPSGAPWFNWVIAIWAIGALAMLARLLAGLVRLAWTTRHAIEFQPGLQPGNSVLISERVAMPMTWGFIHPIILLPVEATHWPADRLRLVLSHELIHAKRRDALMQVVAQLAYSLYWFHPLVWIAIRELARERERACDDAVLNLGADPSRYAEHLLAVARSLNPAAAVAMAQRDTLEKRLRAMLDGGIDRRPATRRNAILTGLVAACLILPLATWRAPAQGNAGGLSGSIHDASGAAIPNAIVTVASADSSRKEIVSTNDTGDYDFRSLAPGTYLLEAKKPGFALFVQPNVTVPENAQQRLDIILKLGRVSETVTVSGKSEPSGALGNRAGISRRVRVGGSVQATRLITHVKPLYPEHARQAGIQGTVLLQAVISKEGVLLGVKALNSLVDPELVDAALAAVSQWRYEPTLLNGEPVEVATDIVVNFRLAP